MRALAGFEEERSVLNTLERGGVAGPVLGGQAGWHPAVLLWNLACGQQLDSSYQLDIDIRVYHQLVSKKTSYGSHKKNQMVAC